MLRGRNQSFKTKIAEFKALTDVAVSVVTGRGLICDTWLEEDDKECCRFCGLHSIAHLYDIISDDSLSRLESTYVM